MAVAALVRDHSLDEHQARRARLWDLINTKSLQRGDFVLSSGEKSKYFFDMKATMLDPEGANLIAQMILEEPEVAQASAIGGLEMGAVPLVSVVCALSFATNKPIPAFFVRKKQKEHGTKALIEGNLKNGQHVVLVDDVTTFGNSVFKAIDAVRERGCDVNAVITVVDRMQGAEAKLAKEGIRLIPLFTRRDFED
jgi:orotate phosphoribosyltransferase